MRDSIQILEANGLSKTKVRKRVLELFLDSEVALSLPDITEALQQSKELDRITLYRTLKAFEEKGIIHKAVDGTQHPKYAMCEADCSEHSHHDNHAHFHCTACDTTICLDDVPTPTIPNVPSGYAIAETTLILAGTCSKCSALT